MANKKRIQLVITDPDLQLLDEMAAAAKKVALWGETGYRPAVIATLLDMVRESGCTVEQIVRRECVISPLIP